MSLSNNFANLKAVIFDCGGTLDSDGIPWKEHFYPFYLKAGLDWDFPQFEKLFFSSDDYWTERRLLRASFRRTLDLQVGLLLKNAGIRDSKLAQKIARGFEADCLKTFKRNKPLIQKLARKYKLGIVSNYYGNMPVHMKEIGYAPYFGVIIDSSRAGVLKPDPQIFHAALKKLKVRPEEAVYVGDNPFRDMKGAKGVGMPHIWLKPDPKGAKPCCEGDVIIRSLLDLEKILL